MRASMNRYCYFFIMLLAIGNFSQAMAQAENDWQVSDESNTALIDHAAWQALLDDYLLVAEDNGVNLFSYGKVSKESKRQLQNYLEKMQAIDPIKFNKQEQKAYWINLYNALTVQLILDNYPVKSITKLGGSIFSFGPWGDDAAKVNGVTLSLNDIEHKILRPIYKDPLIHYAVNCASYSCPNLAAKAFTSHNINEQLTKGARDYVNHPRAVNFDDGDLVVSSIYHWYKEDFGGNDISLVEHLKKYAKPKLKAKLIGFAKNGGDLDHDYNWQLNEAK